MSNTPALSSPSIASDDTCSLLDSPRSPFLNFSFTDRFPGFALDEDTHNKEARSLSVCEDELLRAPVLEQKPFSSPSMCYFQQRTRRNAFSASSDMSIDQSFARAFGIVEESNDKTIDEAEKIQRWQRRLQLAEREIDLPVDEIPILLDDPTVGLMLNQGYAAAAHQDEENVDFLLLKPVNISPSDPFNLSMPSTPNAINRRRPRMREFSQRISVEEVALQAGYAAYQRRSRSARV
jgi:hypothetical protein